MNDEQIIRQYLKERFGNYTDEIENQDSLEDIVDSLGLFDLVSFLEQEFLINIPNEEFSPQLFTSIEKIIGLIGEYRLQN